MPAWAIAAVNGGPEMRVGGARPMGLRMCKLTKAGKLAPALPDC